MYLVTIHHFQDQQDLMFMSLIQAVIFTFMEL